MKKRIAIVLAALVVCFSTTIIARGMSLSPYGSYGKTNLVYLKAIAWFNSGWKTTSDDSAYGVTANKYIKQCYVWITQGDSTNYDYSATYKPSDNGQGTASLEEFNNPFKDQSGGYGWYYN